MDQIFFFFKTLDILLLSNKGWVIYQRQFFRKGICSLSFYFAFVYISLQGRGACLQVVFNQEKIHATDVDT